MIKHVIRFSHRSLVIGFQVVGGTAVLGGAALCVLLWKFSHGPVDITFAARQVSEVLVSKDAATSLHFDSIVAEWPNFYGPVSIGLAGVNLTENGHETLNVPKLGIRIAKLPLLVGLIKPEAVIVMEPTLSLVRHKDGSVHLFFTKDAQKPDAPVVANTTPVIGIKELGESFFRGGNLPDYPSLQPLSQLEILQVQSAHITLADEVSNKSWEIPQLDFDLNRHKNSFDFAFRYNDEKGLPSSLVLALKRDKKSQSIHLMGDMKKVNVATWSHLLTPNVPLQEDGLIVDGHIDGALDPDWALTKLTSDITSDKGTVTLKGIYDVPLTFGNLAAHILFDKTTGTLSLTDTHLTMNDRVINLSGEKKLTDATSVYPLNISVDEVTFDEVHKFWPEAAKKTLLADWLLNRLDKGVVRNLKLSLPFDLNNPNLVDETKVDVALSFEHLNADYQSPLTAVSDAKGSLTLKDDTLTIDVSAGKMADIVIKDGKIVATHLTHPTIIGDVLIDANIVGPLGTYIDYIGRKPIDLSEKVGFKPDDVKGNVEAKVGLKFPGLRDVPLDSFHVNITGKVQDAYLPKVTKGLDLKGGPFNMVVDDEKFAMTGKGILGVTPVDLDYTAYLNLAKAPYVSTVKAKLAADKNIRDAFGVDIDQFINGAVPVEVNYREGKDKIEQVDVVADLTPVLFQIEPLGYKKPIGKSGKATANVSIRNGDVEKIKDLDVAVTGEGGFKGNLTFGKLGKIVDVVAGDFPRVTIGNTNDFSLGFVQASPRNYKFDIKGKKLDARHFTGSHAVEKGQVSVLPTVSPFVEANIQVNQMKTGNLADQYLAMTKMSVATNEHDDVMHLDLKGSLPHGDFNMSLLPDAKGRMRLTVKSSNAGEALRVMDIYNDMVGGELDIIGVQKGDEISNIQGTMRINDFAIVRAPVLAKLINLFSLSGLGELLQNKGIQFEKMMAGFTWSKTGDNRQIYLRDGKMTGSSLGLTFGGVVHQSEGKMDLSGTFVPMSQINGFVSKIPLIGGLLTGGKNGGIIAATYAVKGDSANPSVMINPLSVLTPGFLRTILFEGNSGFLGDETKEPVTPSKKSFNN